MKNMTLMLGLAMTLLALAGCASQPSTDSSASSGSASAAHDYKGEHK